MKEVFTELLVAVITVCVPILANYAVKMIKKEAENAAANTDDIRAKGYIREISNAISTAVSHTSQTYVDSLKAAGTFTAEEQKEAFRKSIDTAISILSPATAQFIDEIYGDIKEHMAPMIEAEVRKQKIETPATYPLLKVDTAEAISRHSTETKTE